VRRGARREAGQGGGGFMTDRHGVLWGMSTGPTGAGKPTQGQLRVKDDKKIFDKLFFLSLSLSLRLEGRKKKPRGDGDGAGMRDPAVCMGDNVPEKDSLRDLRESKRSDFGPQGIQAEKKKVYWANTRTRSGPHRVENSSGKLMKLHPKLFERMDICAMTRN